MKRKEILIIIGVIVLLGVLLFIGCLFNRIERLESELERTNNEYVMVVIDNDNLKDEITDLHNNIYNLFEKKPYELHIEHDNERITYQQDKFGIFDSYTKMTSTILY